MREPGGRGSLRTGAGWKASILGPRDRRTVPILPVNVGGHVIAIEALRVIAVSPGAVYIAPEEPNRPVARVDLHSLLGVSGKSSCETIVARADDRAGRGDGPRVAFAIDGALRLTQVPLEAFAPLPPVAREQIEVDFLVGLVLDPERAPGDDDEGLPAPAMFLLDPVRLARWVDAPAEPGNREERRAQRGR